MNVDNPCTVVCSEDSELYRMVIHLSSLDV